MSVVGVVDIFRQVLKDKNIHTNSDFFTAGGDSLLATRVLSAIAKEFGVELTFVEFLNTPSPAGLAKHIEKRMGGGVS